MYSFSSLFQEWLTTDEASTTTRSFEFTQLVPFPKQEVIIETTLLSNKGEECGFDDNLLFGKWNELCKLKAAGC